MSRLLSVLVTGTLGLAMLPGSAAAQASAPAGNASGQYKIGVVDLQKLVSDYDKRKDKYKQLEEEVKKLQVDIDAMSERIEKARDEYEEKKATMPEDERLAMKNKIEDDFAEYRIELDKRQRLIDNKEESVLKEVFKDVNSAISKVATAENYHLVLNASSGPRGTVLYHNATLDITSQVLVTLNSM